jgi:hypothetical protein
MLYRDLRFSEAIDFAKSMLVFAGAFPNGPLLLCRVLGSERSLNKHYVRVPADAPRAASCQQPASVGSNPLAPCGDCIDQSNPKSHHTAQKGEHFSG